ncbi:DUF7033 domain-containing protein [Calditrichota bacterium]
MTIQILCEPKNITPRLEYIIDFVFSTLGFSWKIVAFEDFKNTEDLIIGYLLPEKLLEYKNLNLINIPYSGQIQDLEQAERQEKIIKVGLEKIPILGKCIRKNNVLNWRKSTDWNYFYQTGYKGWQLEYDLFLNIFYHLSRFEERWRNFVDEAESDWAKSVLSKAGHLQIPTVDILIDYLKKIIYRKAKKTNQATIRILNWPQAEDFGVAFTHDVDITRGVSVKDHMLAKGKMVLYGLAAISDKKIQLKKGIDEKNRNVWSFNEIQNFYKQRNWKATFFFIAKILEGGHLRYNIATEKFEQLFKSLKSNGHEIALHPSLKSFENPKNYVEEKKKLEKYSASKIEGMRQHYLRAKFPRLWEIADRSELKYDSTLGYNFQVGFRSGTCFAHQVFNYSKDRQLNLVEYPLAFFEYNLPEQGIDEKKSIAVINSLIKQVEKYSGLLTVLLHPSNFLQKPYQHYWQYLTAKLQKKKVYVATLADHLTWFFSRRKIIIESQRISSKQLQIVFKKQKHVSHFCFVITPAGEFEEKRNVTIKRLKQNVFQCRSNLSQIKLIFNIN